MSLIRVWIDEETRKKGNKFKNSTAHSLFPPPRAGCSVYPMSSTVSESSESSIVSHIFNDHIKRVIAENRIMATNNRMRPSPKNNMIVVGRLSQFLTIDISLNFDVKLCT